MYSHFLCLWFLDNIHFYVASELRGKSHDLWCDMMIDLRHEINECEFLADHWVAILKTNIHTILKNISIGRYQQEQLESDLNDIFEGFLEIIIDNPMDMVVSLDSITGGTIDFPEGSVPICRIVYPYWKDTRWAYKIAQSAIKNVRNYLPSRNRWDDRLIYSTVKWKCLTLLASELSRSRYDDVGLDLEVMWR